MHVTELITSLAFAPDGKLVAAGLFHGQVDRVTSQRRHPDAMRRRSSSLVRVVGRDARRRRRRPLPRTQNQDDTSE